MNERMLNCELPVPYPPVKTEGKNLYYASLLTNDYAGVVSEMSAVSGYMFQQFITSNAKIADTMKCISIVEMRHLGIIGELITAFGGNPRIAVQSGCKSTYWNAQYISYETNPKCYLKENIGNEKVSISNYTIRISQINDRFVQALLERVILDEENHIRLFSDLLDEFYS